MAERWGVIVTDIQGDFTEWKNGSLAVPGSDESYVRTAEEATRRLLGMGLPVFGTQDWHPPEHVSFASSHPGLDLSIRSRSTVERRSSGRPIACRGPRTPAS